MTTATIDPLLIFGLLAGALSLIGYLPYLNDTLRGRTQPQRASWFIWSVLSCIALAAQIFEGAGSSLWFAGVQCGATCVIFLAALPRGVGGLMHKRDRKVIVAAGIGIALWIATDTPGYALGISIAVSLLGGAVTVQKAYAAPESETLGTWVLSLAASICALIAVGGLSPILLAYPAYLLTLNGAIVAAILVGRQRSRVPSVVATPPLRGDIWATQVHLRKVRALRKVEQPALALAA